MDKWNQEHPDQEVHPGDRFSEAKTVSGEAGGGGVGGAGRRDFWQSAAVR